MAIASQYSICNRCCFRTTLLSRMNDHLVEHNSSKQPSLFSYFDCFDRLEPLKCPTCEFSTESVVLLRYHLVRNHDQQQFALKANLKTCKKCGFCTHSNYLWIRHCNFTTCKGRKGSKGRRKRERVLWKRNGKWYLCEKCDYHTIRKFALKSHIIYKHTPLDEIDWQHCKKCPAKYKTVCDLKYHQKNVHASGVYHLNCPECDYSTLSRSCLRRHFNSKHTRPEEIKRVECYHCGAKFKEKGHLRTHLVRHTNKEKQFKCGQCSFETHCKRNLKDHIINRHLKDDEVKWYNCQHCNYKTKVKTCVKIHIQYMHSESVKLVQCPHCSFKSKWSSSLRLHITNFHDDSSFKCDLCNYRAKLEKTIEIHKKNKHEVGDAKLFKCEHCDYKCNLKFHLKNHVLVKHNVDGEVFQCKQCPYNTPSKMYLTLHINRVHKQKFNCENCSFVTTTKIQLKRHIFNKHRVHTEEEKLSCSHCTYFCFNKEYLKRHLKKKHKIDDKIRWFKCDKCDYKSQRKHSLVGHRYRVHNDGKLLECDQCFYKTGSPYGMQDHKRNHKMKKWIPSERFECDICGFTTNQKKFIKGHITKNHVKAKNGNTK